MLVRYVLRRLWLAVFVVACTVVVTFVIARVVPADPARLYAGGLRATRLPSGEPRSSSALTSRWWCSSGTTSTAWLI